LTNKDTKVANKINLVHGEKTVFGEDGHKAVVIRNGVAQIVDTKDVDESEIYVHNIHEENPTIAFSLSRLSHGPYGPTPLGVFRKVQRDSFTEEVHGQIDMAKEQKGEGELDKLIRSLGTWDVS
jgi:2-oxoglutarate ferredoxin oxidoreductase subunit beta